MQDRAIYQAIKKYSKENFIYYKLDEAETQEDLDAKETYWIKYYNTYLHDGYNMTMGGQLEKKNYSDIEISESLSRSRGGKEFLVFDLNGNYIKTMLSQVLFAKEIGVIPESVNYILSGKRPQVKERILIFKHEYSDELLQSIIDRLKRSGNIKPDFAVFNVETNEFIGIWNSVKKCSEDLNYNNRSIERCLQNEVKNPKRYYFKYIVDMTNAEKNKLKINRGELNET